MNMEVIKKYLDMFKIALIIVVVAVLASIFLLTKIIPETIAYFGNSSTLKRIKPEKKQGLKKVLKLKLSIKIPTVSAIQQQILWPAKFRKLTTL